MVWLREKNRFRSRIRNAEGPRPPAGRAGCRPAPAGRILLAICLALLGAVAGPLTQAGARVTSSTSPSAAPPVAAPGGCVIHSLPAFVAQGEYATYATVADVVEVECDPITYGTGSTVAVTASQLFGRCGEQLTWYTVSPFEQSSGRTVDLTLDADGNATVALIAGPRCQAGESLITAHELEPPYESFTTAFSIVPPETTAQGVFALPPVQVEDATSSGFATIVESEFAEGSEKRVRLASEELYRRCRRSPGLHWISEGRRVVDGPELTGENAVQLDNDGNGFAVAIGDGSCMPGSSLIEADLESKPFTTLTTEFTILPPQPTDRPEFAIEKLQRIAGGGSFVKTPLTGSTGQTVEYEILVTNTGDTPLSLSGFSDPHCDAGTLHGGPGAELLPAGGETIYDCSHTLTSAGKWLNTATVEGLPPSGGQIGRESNTVEVEVPAPQRESAFTVDKLQRIAGEGSFTHSPLTSTVGRTVEYEIVVQNTGQVPITLSGFSDPKCDPGTLAGGPGQTPLEPGEQTTYTCSHVLGEGTWANVATVSASGPGAEILPPLQSPTVEVVAVTPKIGVEHKIEERPGPVCAARIHPVLNGAAGPHLHPFTAWVSSSGVSRVMFYLDRRKLQSFTSRQARRGRFSVRIDPRRLRVGVHRVSVNASPLDTACPRAAASAPFVRPASAVMPAGALHFTG